MPPRRRPDRRRRPYAGTVRIGDHRRGALGGTFAALLARAGHDVEVTARGAGLEAIRERRHPADRRLRRRARARRRRRDAHGARPSSCSCARRRRTPRRADRSERRPHRRRARGGRAERPRRRRTPPRGCCRARRAWACCRSSPPTTPSRAWCGSRRRRRATSAAATARPTPSAVGWPRSSPRRSRSSRSAASAGRSGRSSSSTCSTPCRRSSGASVQEVVDDRAPAPRRHGVDARGGAGRHRARRPLRLAAGPRQRAAPPLRPRCRSAVGQLLPWLMRVRMGAVPNLGSTQQSLRRGQPTEIDLPERRRRARGVRRRSRRARQRGAHRARARGRAARRTAHSRTSARRGAGLTIRESRLSNARRSRSPRVDDGRGPANRAPLVRCCARAMRPCGGVVRSRGTRCPRSR